MSERMEELRISRDYQKARVGIIKIARNRIADGLKYWRERAMKAEAECERLRRTAGER